MSPLVIIAIVAASLVLAFLVFVVVPKLVIAGMRGPLEARVAQRYTSEAIVHSDYAANCFGLESAGRLQSRGNGALVLADKELCFFQFLPAKELVIPLDRVTEITFVHSHLGKATPFKLLKIAFDGPAGPDSAAWWLRDPATFRSTIEDQKTTATSKSS